MLLLAARDAPGNLRPSPPSSWSVSIEAAEGEAPPPLCARVERTEGEHCLLHYAAGGRGLTGPTTVRLVVAHGGAPVRGAPLQLTLLPPAFGHGLCCATAGEAARFWVYLGAAPRAVPQGSAEERQALQSLRVELTNADEPTARVEIAISPPELCVLRGEEAWAGAADQLAEVRYVCTKASPRWRVHVSLDGEQVCGSPFHCDVRPAAPCLTRSQLHGPWVGSGRLVAGGQQHGILQLRDALCNECDVGVGGRVRATLTHAPRSTFEGGLEGIAASHQQCDDLGNGCYAVTLLAWRVGRYALSFELDSRPLACSCLIEVVAAAAEARSSVLYPPPSGTLQPGQWNPLRLRCADRSGNSSTVQRRGSVRLHGRCEEGGGAMRPEHLVLHGADGPHEDSAGEFVVWVFGWPISRLVIAVELDGEHVAGSPTLLEVAAGGAAPGRCYARGEGVETQQILCSGRQPHRFAIVACDATGLPRSHGGDAFEVRVLPHGHAHHVAPTTVTVYDQGDGVHAVEWLPPFSGDYLVHVRLGGLHIYGSPFPCALRGAAPTARAREHAARSPQARRAVAWGDEPPQLARPVQPTRPPSLLPWARAQHATLDGPVDMFSPHLERSSSLPPGTAPPGSTPPRTLPLSPSGTVLTPPTSAPAPLHPPQATRLMRMLDRDAVAPANAAQLSGGGTGDGHQSLEGLIAALRQTVEMLK